MKIKILADVSLPHLQHCFPAPFEVTCYQTPRDIPLLAQGCDILICRSTLTVDHALLQDTHFTYIATASSGVDHIDLPYLAQKGITCIDAKGANAHAVADYILSILAHLQRIQPLTGKTIGIIGAGCVGSIVATQVKNLGFYPLCYDPPRALFDQSFKSISRSNLYQCDIICVHANLHHHAPHSTYHFIDQDFLSRLKPGTIIINAARGGIVDETALIHYSDKIIYCTDVYFNEPDIDPKIIAMATLCTPHIAGHSIEAKYNAVAQISDGLHRAFGLQPVVREKKQHINGKPGAQNWQSWIMSLYDPIQETNALKNEIHALKNAFLTLRQAHQYRHDFDVYEAHKVFTTA